MVDTVAIPAKVDIAVDNIDWDTVIQKGAESAAEALGTAFGTAVGGPIGAFVAEAFLSALFGQGDDPAAAMQKEILQRLGVIEKKLDDFVAYVKNELPVVIRHEMDAALLTQLSFTLKAKSETAAQMLAIIYAKGKLEPTEKTLLAVATFQLSELGIQLLSNGKEYMLGGLQAFIMSLGGYKVLIANDPHYAEGLKSMAAQYAGLLRPMISDGNDEKISFVPIERRLVMEIASATPYENTILGPHVFAVEMVCEGSGFGDPIVCHSTYYETTVVADENNVLRGEPLLKRIDGGLYDPNLLNSDCPWAPNPLPIRHGETASSHALEAIAAGQRLFTFIKVNPMRSEFIRACTHIAGMQLKSCEQIINAQ